MSTLSKEANLEHSQTAPSWKNIIEVANSAIKRARDDDQEPKQLLNLLESYKFQIPKERQEEVLQTVMKAAIASCPEVWYEQITSFLLDQISEIGLTRLLVGSDYILRFCDISKYGYRVENKNIDSTCIHFVLNKRANLE